MDEARRQKNSPPGLSTRHVPRSIAGEFRVVAGEVQHGAADHDVGEGLRERVRLDGCDAEIAGRELGRQTRGQRLHGLDRGRVRIDAEHLEAAAQQMHEIASRSAAHVEHPHARRDAAAQQLVEQVDVDVAELFAQIANKCIGHA